MNAKRSRTLTQINTEGSFSILPFIDKMYISIRHLYLVLALPIKI